ncbi:MAG: ATP-binding cassette domain-containing protein [Proteobacteria bacterium]|nr:ATP-binding cassette domain-containing protein [Pseudomonadota bacterium]
MFGTLSDWGAIVAPNPPSLAQQEPSEPGEGTPSALPFAAYGLRKAFGDKPVLNGLNLDVRGGEFIAIIGKSGCGKSTFLRLLAGLDEADAGLLAYGGEGRARQPGDVRVMFQEPRLLPWLSVIANVEIGLGEGGEAKTRRERALAALEAVGLGARADEWPSVLSGGQKQRVALARALVSAPGILALDEPLGALDALTRIEMQQLLERVWQDQGFTALMVTHDVPEAVALADRIILIEDGRVTLDRPVHLPRPRQRGSTAYGALEAEILARLLTG